MQTESNQLLYIGLSSDSEHYTACVLRKSSDKIEMLNSYSVPKDTGSYAGLLDTIKQDFSGQQFSIAMGFDDSCVGFYKIQIPVVGEKQLPAVIAAQAEVCLPLPPDQMQYSWKTLSQSDGLFVISIAAAKRDMLSSVISSAGNVNADKIILSSEAIVKAVMFLSENHPADFVLLKLNHKDIRLFFVNNGILAKVVKLDSTQSPDHDQPNIALLCHDIRNVLDQYTDTPNNALPIYIDGSGNLMHEIERGLNNSDLKTNRIIYNWQKIENSLQSDLPLQSTGLALIAIENSRQYDLFGSSYQKSSIARTRSDSKKKNYFLAVCTCLLFLIFIAVSYSADRHRLQSYKKQMDTPEFDQMYQQHSLRSTIAQQRLQIPALIEKINAATPNGVKVTGLTFRKSQRFAVKASTGDPKKMYAFMDSLNKCKGIKTVKLTGQGRDDKKNKTTFTLTFDYKKFTSKRKQ